MKMNEQEVSRIAEMCHEINRAYCEALGDNSQKPWKFAPEWQKKSAISGVKHVFDNPSDKPSAIHDAWLRDKRKEGWKFGPVKDVEKREHPCCVEYDELPKEQRVKDYLFRSVVEVMKSDTRKAHLDGLA